jgi:hypothetical protein
MSCFLARTHAAAAQHTEVVVPVEEWIILFNGQPPIGDGVGYLSEIQIVHQLLKLALSVRGAVLAACGYGCFADGALKISAVRLTD